MANQIPEERAAAAPAATARTARQSSLSTVKNYKDFRLVWMGNFVALSGQWIQLLTVGWLVLHLTGGNALLTGTVVAIRTLPVLIIGPWAGVLADRLDRRKLVMATQTAMAVSAILFAVLVAATDLDSDPISGPLRWWHPFVYMIVAGIAHSIIQPVRQAMIANTVPREALTSALALNGMVYPSTRIIAPAIGGILIATLGFKWNFFLEAAAYIAIILLLIPVKLPYKTETAKRTSPMESLKDGIRYVWHERSIVQLIVLVFIPNFVFQPLIFILPVFTTEVLGRGVGAGGILAAAMGVGGIVAGAIIAGLGFVFRRGQVTFAGLIGGCIFVILFAQTAWLFAPFSQSVWLVASFAFLTGLGFCQYAFRVANSTLIQTIVPDALRGRVMSIYMLDHGFTPLATLLISLLVHVWNPSGAFTVIGGVALAISILLALTFHHVRRLD